MTQVMTCFLVFYGEVSIETRCRHVLQAAAPRYVSHLSEPEFEPRCRSFMKQAPKEQSENTRDGFEGPLAAEVSINTPSLRSCSWELFSTERALLRL